MQPTRTTTSMIARSSAMEAVFERVDTIAATDSSVLLIGETGVGKELLAEYIHRSSRRDQRSFVKIGLSAVPADLLESELFGHEKGAYTSAASEKKGLFELAHTGTIFLDDIDDFPVHLQAKLLRVLESRELMRIGGTQTIQINVRVICASKIDLKELVDRGAFRSDLYYRINVVPIIIPPLRDRREDIPLLVDHYLRRYSPDQTIEIDTAALSTLSEYSWPGNVRELRNVVQRIALFAKGRIEIKDLPIEIRSNNEMSTLLKACNRCMIESKMSFEELVTCLESNLLRQALEQTHGNRSQAAKLLKMSLSTLRDKLKKYNLNGES